MVLLKLLWYNIYKRGFMDGFNYASTTKSTTVHINFNKKI